MGKRTYHTPQIRALFLPKSRTSFLYPPRQRDLDILRHRLLTITHTTLLLRLPNHLLNPLNRLLAIMEAARNLLRQPLDHALVLPADVLVPEPGEQVLVVQFIQLGGFERDIAQ